MGHGPLKPPSYQVMSQIGYCKNLRFYQYLLPLLGQCPKVYYFSYIQFHQYRLVDNFCYCTVTKLRPEHFQDIYFEAVVSVNLTSMLVLATMFISVISSIHTTSYIKMIDVWLIFNLMIPFLLVLLHTYMESLRTEAKDDGEERTTNHHGTAINVGTLDSSIRSSKIDVDNSRDLQVLELKQLLLLYMLLLLYFFKGSETAL